LQTPKVYIVIVNYNGWKDTLECLESVLKSHYTNFQIIVIDNSPNDVSWLKINDWATKGQDIKTHYPHLVYPEVSKPFDSFISLSEKDLFKQTYLEKILFVKSIINKGFSAGNNIGLRYALKCTDFDYVWLLNNDTVANSDALSHLIKYMYEIGNQNIGIAGAKILEYDNPTIIQNAGGGKLNKLLAYSHLIGAGEKDSGQFDAENVKLDFVAGTSMFVRKQFLIEVGLLDENYFLYFEESDWAERGYDYGWGLGYCYQSTVYHKGGASTGGKGYSSATQSSTPFSDYYFQRSKVIFTKKFFWYFLPVLYLSFALVIFNRIRRGQFDRLRLILSILVNPNKPYPDNI